MAWCTVLLWSVLNAPTLVRGEEPPEPYKIRVAYSPTLRGVPSWSAELDCARVPRVIPLTLRSRLLAKVRNAALS